VAERHNHQILAFVQGFGRPAFGVAPTVKNALDYVPRVGAGGANLGKETYVGDVVREICGVGRGWSRGWLSGTGASVIIEDRVRTERCEANCQANEGAGSDGEQSTSGALTMTTEALSAFGKVRVSTGLLPRLCIDCHLEVSFLTS
jgi:hypothetical protein